MRKRPQDPNAAWRTRAMPGELLRVREIDDAIERLGRERNKIIARCGMRVVYYRNLEMERSHAAS